MFYSFIKKISLFILILSMTACGGGTGSQNSPPVAVDDVASLNQNANGTINLVATDADNDPLTYITTSNPQHGSVTLSGNTASYIPNSGFSGTDSFSFKANDGSADSNIATISLTIDATPATNNLIAADETVNATQNTDVVINLVATASSNVGSLTYSLVTQPLHGSIVLNTNVVTYTPTTGFAGSDSFTFKANNGTLDSNVATIDIEIGATSSINGVISKVNGDFIDGVTIEVLDASLNILSTTDSSENGEFSVTEKINTNLTLRLTKAGFATQVKNITTPSVQNYIVPLAVTMIELGAAQAIDISTGGTLAGESGASVTVSPNSFVDQNGNTVTGDIQVNITPIDVSNPSILAAFPGSFSGVVESTGATSTIVSAGTTYFDFSQNGQVLQLADGMTADIQLPIFLTTNPNTGSPIELGDTIELWYLNESTGVWIQDGTGTVVSSTSSPTGYALQATVSHFTPWNVDFPIEVSYLDVNVTGTVNGGVATVFVENNGFGWFNSSSPIVVGNTETYLVPAFGETCVWLQYTDTTGASATTNSQCVDVAQTNTTYNLSFSINTSGSLVLRNIYNRNSYQINTLMSISINPLSLESSVSYVIESGTLPTGLSLNANGATGAKIIGTTTALGNYSVVVKGTDSDGFTDSKTISFDIVNPPPPSLYSSTYIFDNTGNDVSQDLSNRIMNSTNPATHWIITNADGTAVPPNVTISSAGVVNVTGFDGVDVIYKVAAYNQYGSSNLMDLHVKNLNSVPILGNQIQVTFDSTMQNNQFQFYVPNNSPPATSWTITKMDGSAVSATDLELNSSTGLLQIHTTGGGEVYDGAQFKLTASNSAGSSNTETITFFDIMQGGGGCMPGDPLCGGGCMPGDPLCQGTP